MKEVSELEQRRDVFFEEVCKILFNCNEVGRDGFDAIKKKETFREVFSIESIK